MDNQTFKYYVIQRIKDFAAANPGTWIKLNLSNNSLGRDLEFLRNLLQEIVITVHSLNIDLTALSLYINQLWSLPEGCFEGLDNLKGLDLSWNLLTSLPEHLFDGLKNLETLDLQRNYLTSLPEYLFERLINLQKLDIKSNHLNEESTGLLQALRNKGVKVEYW